MCKLNVPGVTRNISKTLQSEFEIICNMKSNKSCVLLPNAGCNIWAIWHRILLLPHKGLACLHGVQSLPCYLSPPQLWETPCQQSLSGVTWLWINPTGEALNLSLHFVVCRQGCHVTFLRFIFRNIHWPGFLKPPMYDFPLYYYFFFPVL